MDHAYLMLSLVAFAAGGIAAFLAGQRRWLVLTSGALATPAGLGDWLFVPEYWEPVHVVGPWLSLEGTLLSFGNGCLILALALPRGTRAAPPENAAHALLRLSWQMVSGAVVFVIAWRGAGLMVMHAVFVAFAFMFALLGWQRRLSVSLSLRGGFGLFVVHAAGTLAWYGLDANFADLWGSDDYFWRLPFPPGIPVEEYLWAAVYGALWANMIGFGFAAAAVPDTATRVRA
ncbi:hypothetical protein [Phaeovulum sp.]|uniref:hypothetical protein n=1 Tax=Phaeovulum sp. TaxID=2934796 RepID=UPI00272F02FD|nr:hypothetical protein [Phaeovulum sp.]MDP1668616.1 hypothetical protein [Phaeovulum sp.]MDZ4119895.1 hypothetical protein [Phaeovulum sp.]